MACSRLPIVGRANSALNVLHLTAVWAVQPGMDLVIARWVRASQGGYPSLAAEPRLQSSLAVQVPAGAVAAAPQVKPPAQA